MVYCGKTNSMDNLPSTFCREAMVTHKVILGLIQHIGHKNRVLVVDNYFTSINLFMDLLARGIYTTVL